MTDNRPPGQDQWVYESIVRSLPGIQTSRTRAVAVQFVGFEAAVILLGIYHGFPAAMVAGTVGVVVAVAGSLFMLHLGTTIRDVSVPATYRRALLGSRFELVLGLVAFVLLVVYAFVYDPQSGPPVLVTELLGDSPPPGYSFVLLLIGWDVAYRIGVGWWAAVLALWRSIKYHTELDDATKAQYRRIDMLTIAFSSLQLLIVPVLAGHPILQAIVLGHVLAVWLVAGMAFVVLWLRK